LDEFCQTADAMNAINNAKNVGGIAIKGGTMGLSSNSLKNLILNARL
jgi:hypothetical protein